MKKYLGLLLLVLLINSCDDGYVTVQDISFESVAAANCGQIVYKIKSNQILLIKITENDTAFKSDQTKLNKPRIYNINANNSVTYRSYNGEVSGDNICINPPATKPDVTEEWKAISGTIEITTTVNKSTNTTTNATTIAGYNHSVTFRNITFSKPNGNQFYDVFNFGFYKTTITPLNLSFSTTVQKCSLVANKIITNKIGSVALMSYDNNPDNINTTIGVKTAAISATNKLYYRTFANLDPANYLCNATFGAGSTMLQEWVATSGTVEITTTNNVGTSLKHTINLKGVNLKFGNSDFYLGDNFNLGEIVN